MREYATVLAEAEAIAMHNKAVAEIGFLAGAAPDRAATEGVLP